MPYHYELRVCPLRERDTTAVGANSLTCFMTNRCALCSMLHEIFPLKKIKQKLEGSSLFLIYSMCSQFSIFLSQECALSPFFQTINQIWICVCMLSHSSVACTDTILIANKIRIHFKLYKDNSNFLFYNINYYIKVRLLQFQIYYMFIV